jgi:hypothetical protein
LSAPRQEDVRQAGGRVARLRAELEASRTRRAAEQEQRRLERELEEAQHAERLQQCLIAQQNLHTLEIRRPVYHIDEHGERVYLDDEQRAAEIARMRTEIEIYCD